MATTGRHVIVDVWGVNNEYLDNENYILNVLEMCARSTGATILHSWSHKFEPQGVTALVGLAESHASIHTHPELQYYSADIFTCGDIDPRKGMASLVQTLGGRAQGWFIERGGTRTPLAFVA